MLVWVLMFLLSLPLGGVSALGHVICAICERNSCFFIWFHLHLNIDPQTLLLVRQG